MHATYLAAAAGTLILSGCLFFRRELPVDRAASRHLASLGLSSFAVLHAYQLQGSVATWSLPYLALALCTLYEDPRCLWPGIVVIAVATLIAPTVGWVLFSPQTAAATSVRTLGELSLYLVGAGTALRISSLLKTRTRRALERQRTLVAENTRLSADLEHARSQLLDAATALSKRASAPRIDGFADEHARDRRRLFALDAAPEAIVVIAAHSGLIVDLNARAAELTGRTLDEAVGSEHVLLYPASRESLIRTIFRHVVAGDRRFVEAEVIHRNGAITAVEVAFGLAHSPHEPLVIAVFRDITDRKRAEARRAVLGARHQEMLRLEGLHAMAAGVAHDFNNILMTILGFASIGRDRCGGHPIAQQYFERIENATLRAGDVCRQMLTFAGRGRVTVHSADLNALLRELEPTLRAQLNPLVELEITPAPNLPEVCFDATSVAKTIEILFTNAVEAIGDRAGLVHIRTLLVPANDPLRDESFLTPELTGDTHVVIEMSDTGSGIAPSAIGRVFEPFYSTKSIGRGLGLSEALGVIRAQRGAIQVTSTLGEGSTFRVYLPAAPCPRNPPVVRRPALSRKPAAPRARNVALVIEDETAVRELVSSMVEELGFTVHRAVDGTEGIALFEQFGP
ncbi:MAG TPA: ATP-binding protein, partial [Opitutaceae bacterium]